MLVSTGGPFPQDPGTLAIRWTGYGNFGWRSTGRSSCSTRISTAAVFSPLRFSAADVKRADVILIGHGHVDHMSDAASVGARTGAPSSARR
jgi:L-ascorbate metabolism protein UlaG (beta-lactamase superfamily)